MEGNEIFTDKLVDEILESNLSIDDQKILIYKRYTEKGFTMIGVRKEIRIVQDRIQENMINRLDDITTIILTILGSCVSYLILDSIFNKAILLKICISIITLCVLSLVFFKTLKEIKDRCSVYKLCLVRLVDILEDIETQLRMAEMKKIIDSEIEQGNIFNVNKPEEEAEDILEKAEEEEEEEEIEIDSFEVEYDEEVDLEIA